MIVHQGGAEIDNSGYFSDWTQQENTFDNEYYDTLVDPGNPNWEQIEVPQSGKFQWRWDCNQNGNGCRDLSKSWLLFCLRMLYALLH